jgi:hypothetical protein
LIVDCAPVSWGVPTPETTEDHDRQTRLYSARCAEARRLRRHQAAKWDPWFARSAILKGSDKGSKPHGSGQSEYGIAHIE